MIDLRLGNMLKVLPTLDADSVDAVVCDPPYDLTQTGRALRLGPVGGFMGKQWDGTGIAFQVETWQQVYRVMKPGAHLLAFGGTRTYHRMVCAIEDAGFEIRDCLQWLYGSGFPKSMDVSKQFDKMAGADREVVGSRSYCYPDTARPGHNTPQSDDDATRQIYQKGIKFQGSQVPITAPATDLARQWSGWGTALKPACEPIVMARKPLSEATVAANVAKHGTGAINIDKCRIGAGERVQKGAGGWVNPGTGGDDPVYALGTGREYHTSGRWPANVILSHSDDCRQVGTRRVKGSHDTTGVWSNGKRQSGFAMNGAVTQGYADADGCEQVDAWECAPGCAVAELDRQSGISRSVGGSGPASKTWKGDGHTVGAYLAGATGGFGDTGGASRFFYVAKASRSERAHGLPDHIKAVHPTVKPVQLMRYLIRLVTPPGGTVLDPFAGSGSTLVAAIHEGFDGIGIEQDESYFAICEARTKAAAATFHQLELVP